MILKDPRLILDGYMRKIQRTFFLIKCFKEKMLTLSKIINSIENLISFFFVVLDLPCRTRAFSRCSE